MYDEMTAKNAAELERLDAAIKEAQKDFGETEVRETSLAKADFLCSIGDKVRHHLRTLAHYKLIHTDWHSTWSCTTTTDCTLNDVARVCDCTPCDTLSYCCRANCTHSMDLWRSQLVLADLSLISHQGLCLEPMANCALIIAFPIYTDSTIHNACAFYRRGQLPCMTRR